MAGGLLEQLGQLHTFSHRCDDVIVTLFENTFAILKKWDPKVPDSKKSLGLATMRHLSMPQTCSISTPYFVLFELQVCSPQDELNVVWYYHAWKQRNR